MAKTLDLSEFHKLSRPRKAPCKVGLAASRLETDEERAQLAAACAADTNVITGGAIAKWIEVRVSNTALSPAAITHHRRRSCTCADG